MAQKGFAQNPLRETFFSESYKNPRYEGEARPRNNRDFIGTFQQSDSSYHNMGAKQDPMKYHKRGLDDRSTLDTKHRFGSITGNTKKYNPVMDSFKTMSHSNLQSDKMNAQRKHLSAQKTAHLTGSDILHQAGHEESKAICDSWKVPAREQRVHRYMGSSQVKNSMTLPSKAGEMEPKPTIYGFGAPQPRDVWAPKAYRAHANSGNQRFYVD